MTQMQRRRVLMAAQNTGDADLVSNFTPIDQDFAWMTYKTIALSEPLVSGTVYRLVVDATLDADSYISVMFGDTNWGGYSVKFSVGQNGPEEKTHDTVKAGSQTLYLFVRGPSNDGVPRHAVIRSVKLYKSNT